MKRRTFIKTASLLGVLPFVNPLMSQSSFTALIASPMRFSKDLIRDGEVVTAAHWGPLKVTLKDGKVTKSGPALNVTRIHNPLQHYVGDLIENTRVLHPLIRKSYFDNPSSPRPELRGRDEWVQVSYKTAIRYITNALKRTIDTHGNDAIWGGSEGWKSAGVLHVANPLLQRFLGTIGGFTSQSGDYSAGASQVIMPHVLGTIEVYENMSSWEDLLANSEQIVIWGANPYITTRNASASADGLGIDYFDKLRKNYAKGGVDIIMIDPVYNETAQFFKLDKRNQIQVRQGSDTALMLGIMHELYSSGRYDKEFLDTYTVGFDKFLPYLLGDADLDIAKSDIYKRAKQTGSKKDKTALLDLALSNLEKVPKTKEWAEIITGIPAKQIRALAHKMKDKRTMIMSGWSMQRQDHGEQPHFMLVTLACMLGQIGLKGGGFGLAYHRNSGVPSRISAVIGGMGTACSIPPNGPYSHGKCSHTILPLARITDCIQHAGRTIDSNGVRITYPDIHLIYWAGGNPIVHQQNVNNNIEAFRSLDTFIINEIYFTPTARMADIIMPATTAYERNDMSMTGDYSLANIVPMKACVAPRGEARSDYEIFSDLAREFGTYDSFTDGGKSEFDWLRQFYTQALSQAKGLMINLPSFEVFWRENKPITFAPSEEARGFVRYADFREDPILSPLGTPSGLIEIYSKTIAAMRYKDCPPHASFLEPIEWIGRGRSMEGEEMGFTLVSAHPNSRIHSQLSNTRLRDTYAIAGREPIWINKKDARRLGIKTGDIVRVFNARGEVLAGAKVTKNIARHTVRLAEGAWYSPVGANISGFAGKRDMARKNVVSQSRAKVGELYKDKQGRLVLKGTKGTTPLCLNGCVNLLTIDKPTSPLANATIAHTTLVNIEKFHGKAPRVYVFDEIVPDYVEDA